jgi:hypothetical protein
MGSIKATVVSTISHDLGKSVHGKHTWHRVMPAASDHHEIDRKFILVLWAPVVNLIEVVAKDEAIPVSVITPGSIW